jgi:PAS domain-containing protein
MGNYHAGFLGGLGPAMATGYPVFGSHKCCLSQRSKGKLVPSNRGKEMGEEDKLDRDLQIHLDEKTNDFSATELLPENAVWEARRLLERERRLLQSMINGARNYHLVYLDRDFNFVHVNEAYAKTCGYRPNELVGKNHFDLYPHE